MGISGGKDKPSASDGPALSPAPAAAVVVETDAGRTMYVGGYTRNIYKVTVDEKGALKDFAEYEAGDKPSFLAVSSCGGFLYAVLEGEAACASFSIDKESGALTKLNQQPTQGLYPCHLAIAGKYVVCANYGGGNVCVLPVDTDGSLREASDVQQHSVDTEKAKQAAKVLHDAVVGWGTDETSIFRCLSSNVCDTQDEWSAVQRAFKAAYPDRVGGDLIGALRGDMAQAELDKCAELMRKNGVACWEPAPTKSAYQTARQDAAHAHQVCVSPDGYVYSMDLGLDAVFQWVLSQETGKLSPNPAGAYVTGAYGSGPRHMAFHPTAPIAYVINELDATVLPLRYNAANGALAKLPAVPTLPKGAAFSAVPPPTEAGDFDGTVSCCADVHFHTSGKFAYGSNRGHDSIAVYSVAEDGAPQPAGHVPSGGFTPRNFCVHPDGAVMVVGNQNAGAKDDGQGGGNLSTFAIDAATGALTPTGSVMPMKWPSCIVFAN